MMCKVCCLFVLLLLVGLACAQAEPPEQMRVAQAPPTVDPQAAKPRAPNAWSCEVPIPTLAGASARLANVCGNHTGQPRIITQVACITETGTAQFTPQLTGGDATSILATPLACTTTWTEGTLNGQPRVRTFAKTGMACAGGCTIDFAISGASGTTGIVLVISGDYE